jgi:hypothetical protein
MKVEHVECSCGNNALVSQKETLNNEREYACMFSALTCKQVFCVFIVQRVDLVIDGVPAEHTRFCQAIQGADCGRFRNVP